MAKLSQTSPEKRGQKVLVYGPPKAGKTLLVAMLASKFNLIWFDFEHGALTLYQLPVEYQDRIEYIKVLDDRKTYQGITTALQITEGKAIQICDAHGRVGSCSICALARTTGNPNNVGNMVPFQAEFLPHNTIIVCDSLTQLSHSAMAKALGGWEDEATKPEFKHYTAQGFYLDRVLTAVQNSTANWVFISHEESLEQEDGSDKIVPVAGTRNFSKNSARYFDHVIYCSIANYKYSAISSGVDNMSVLSGSRTGVSIKANNNLDKLVEIFTPSQVPAKLTAQGQGAQGAPSGATATTATPTKPLTALERARLAAQAAKNSGA